MGTSAVTVEWVSYDLTAAANQAEAKGLQPRAQGWLVLLLIHEQAIRLFAFFSWQSFLLKFA